MQAKAVAKYVRISPRKGRQVIDLIRGKSVPEAMAVLRYTPKRAAGIIGKVLKSAAANAENNFDLDPDDMFVAHCYVDEGPSMKRVMPRARGRADWIRKRSSHITIVLDEKE